MDKRVGLKSSFPKSISDLFPKSTAFSRYAALKKGGNYAVVAISKEYPCIASSSGITESEIKSALKLEKVVIISPLPKSKEKSVEAFLNSKIKK